MIRMTGPPDAVLRSLPVSSLCRCAADCNSCQSQPRRVYVARFNPLEENFRVYKVVDGVRTQLQSAGAKRTEGWRTLRVWMFGDHIRCELDGRPLLDVKDGTFSEPGKVGFWTKSDARTRFDDFTRMAFE